jgi:hypothetical protein
VKSLFLTAESIDRWRRSSLAQLDMVLRQWRSEQSEVPIERYQYLFSLLILDGLPSVPNHEEHQREFGERRVMSRSWTTGFDRDSTLVNDLIFFHSCPRPWTTDQRRWSNFLGRSCLIPAIECNYLGLFHNFVRFWHNILGRFWFILSIWSTFSACQQAWRLTLGNFCWHRLKLLRWVSDVLEMGLWSSWIVWFSLS